MAFCTNCGAKLPDGSRFCTECGAAIAASAPATPAEPEKKYTAFARKVLSGSLIAPSSSALWAIYFRTSGLALSIVPLEVMNATTPPVRTLSRAFAKK